MFIVTGGAGFIGSNLVKGLNQKGIDDILVVDRLKDSTKIPNLADCKFADYLDKADFLEKIKTNTRFADSIKAIFHQGACSDTTEQNGQYLMENNFEYSKEVLNYCIKQDIPFIYASSASVYGAGPTYKEHPDHEKPINAYAFSKFVFDQYVRKVLPDTKLPIIGLRYFNVYGPREAHKGPMASVVFHFNKQAKQNNTIQLFQGSGGYKDGEQRRDFIYIDDVIHINVWFLEHLKSGIYNVGTGQSSSFNQVAKALNKGSIQYIPFPEHLKNHYQHFTEADISLLRKAGYDKSFTPIEEGVKQYLKWL